MIRNEALRKVRCAFATLTLLAIFWSCQPVYAADFSEARKLFQQGEYQKCLDMVTTAIDENSFGEHWYVLKIRAELELGKYDAALKTADDGIKDYANSIQIRWYAIDAARFTNDPRRALTFKEEIAEQSTRAWRYRDADNQIILSRFDLQRGVDPAKVLSERLDPFGKNYSPIHMAIADLGFDKHDYQLAANHFLKAAQLDPTNPDAFFGIAKAFAPSDNKKTNEAIQQALELNANHVSSLLFIAERRIDEENYAEAKKMLAKVLKVNSLQHQALSLLAAIAHLENDPKEESRFRKLALSTWKGNPEVDHLIGKKLSQKYRFKEGAEYQRRSLVYDKHFLPAKAQLTQDLLRLGKELEGWKLADEVYDADGYNVTAHNLVALRSNITNFATIESDGFVIRMDEQEAIIYGDRVLALLKKAKSHLCKKYEIEVSDPIVVEIFPKQQDFAIRTFGLPGGAGYLGVCFGSVITMNSPASQGTTPTNWQSVLWHEFCHVVTLQKTKNKMPRWLSEGISVYEERIANPTWGQSLDGRNRKMILGEDLTPVSQLSGAFLRPASAAHLQFAYFESSLVVEYLIEKYGLDTLKRVLQDLEIGLTINQSLSRYTGSVQLLDKEFETWARNRAKKHAPGVEFELPEVTGQMDPAMIKKLYENSPNNFALKVQHARILIAAENLDEARKVIESMIELHPDAAVSYKLLAEIAVKMKLPELEKSSLEKLIARQSDQFDAQTRLAEMAVAAKNWQAAEKHATEAAAINPLLPAPHRILATVGQQLDHPALTAQSIRALLVMDPLDPADAHFRLAEALWKLNDLDGARRHILLSLEQAPRYRKAHQLLLKIHRKRAPGNPNDSESRKKKESSK